MFHDLTRIGLCAQVKALSEDTQAASSLFWFQLVLVEELENPMNVHRWRKLEGPMFDTLRELKHHHPAMSCCACKLLLSTVQFASFMYDSEKALGARLPPHRSCSLQTPFPLTCRTMLR